MLTVPASLTQAFDSQLSQRNIPNHQRRDFHEWLRFYLDYCAKYASDPKLTASFAGFDEKLKSKDQSEAQRKQARRSIGIYYRMIGVIKSTQADSGNPATKNAAPLAASVTPHQEISKQADLPAAKREMPQSTVTDQPLKLTGANWEWVYESLQAAIKVRHYSNKTWQAYRYWLQQFQNFTKSKDASLLDMGDVKGFLSHLAMNR